jgi:hypothetical protein
MQAHREIAPRACTDRGADLDLAKAWIRPLARYDRRHFDPRMAGGVGAEN